MEERRSRLRQAAEVAALVALAGPALACDPGLEGTRIESARHVLAWRAAPIAVGRHFALEVAACARSGPPPAALKVDAHMPAHRHGMNYAPKVERVAPGRWRAEGLMFHMPGAWEFVFELPGEGAPDVLRSAYELGLLPFTPAEKARILAHGPWPPPLPPDPSNRVSGQKAAIALGERLFFDPRLSRSGELLCASCHVPFRAFQDGRAVALGAAPLDRNTPSVLNARFHRWFGWDGANDSLWAQSLRPLLDPREMGNTKAGVLEFVRSSQKASYEKAFGPLGDEETAFVNVGKALAAYQETLVTGRTPFDEFRDALAAGDEAAASRYPLPAQRGLRIFVGKGNCSVCHFGPAFTNGEFADVGIPFFTGPGRVDPGRHGGIEKLRASPYNRLGPHSDDASGKSATGTRHVEAQHRNFGEFRVPGLREVGRTGPYMHNGRLATLRDVVLHYSELNEERLHADGEKILRPLKLSEAEIGDLVAFLESLTQKPQ